MQGRYGWKKFFLHTSNIEIIVRSVNNFFEFNSKLTVGDFKNISGLTRKTAIPFLEYLDRNQITVRNNNIRLKGNAVER